jgi:flagellar protein FliO/FliZ
MLSSMTAGQEGRIQLRHKITGLLFILSLGLLAVSPICMAEGGSSMDTNVPRDISALTQSDAPSVILMMAQVIFYLILIIGFFFVIMKILAQKNRRRMHGRAVNPLGGVPLGQNKSLQIVEIGRSIYLLGVGDNVQLVHKIDDPDEAAYLIASMTTQSESSVVGMKQLNKWFSRFRQQDHAIELDRREDHVAHSFQEVFQSKMSHMANRKQMVEELLNNQKYTDRSSEE